MSGACHTVLWDFRIGTCTVRTKFEWKLSEMTRSLVHVPEPEPWSPGPWTGRGLGRGRRRRESRRDPQEFRGMESQTNHLTMSRKFCHDSVVTERLRKEPRREKTRRDRDDPITDTTVCCVIIDGGGWAVGRGGHWPCPRWERCSDVLQVPRVR